jgi:hypothetical protein
MKHQMAEKRRDEGVVIAVFGDAQLVAAEGCLELRGGTMADRSEALEWVSLFMPEAAARVKLASP